MKKSILALGILVGLTSAAASATTINIRHEYVPKYDHQTASNKQRIAVSNRFANGIGFEVEAKWKSNDRPSGDNDAFNRETGNGQQANISYAYKINKQFTLTPQYKWDSGSDHIGHQFNLTLGYKVNSDWAVSFRHRYHYQNVVGGDNYHYNRWTFGASYNGINNWGLSGSTDYTFNESKKGDAYKDHRNWFTEVNFKAEYKGFESGWRPFTELGMVPYKKDGSDTKDAWRPRVRVGVKYSW